MHNLTAKNENKSSINIPHAQGEMGFQVLYVVAAPTYTKEQSTPIIGCEIGTWNLTDC